MSQPEVWKLRPSGFHRGTELQGEIPAWRKGIALPAILSGKMIFHERPPSPPFEILRFLEPKMRLIYGDVLGPTLEGSRFLKEIQLRLIPNGVSQTLVDGETVHWFKGFQGLCRTIGETLSECAERRSDLVGEVAWLIGVDIRKYVIGKQTKSDLEDFLPLNGSDWKEFRLKCLPILDVFKDYLIMALREAQVVVRIDGPAGSSMIAPTIVARTRIVDYGPEHSFLLSRNLPSSLKKKASMPADQAALARAKREAEIWLRKANRHFEPKRRFSREVAMSAVMKLFGLSRNAASEVFKSATRDDPRSAGRIPKEESVSLKDLLAWNGIGE